MTELKRWLDDDVPPSVARLLRAGQRECPSNRAVERTVMAVGAACATGALASQSSAAYEASSNLAGSTRRHLAQWAIFGVVGLGVAVTVVVGARYFAAHSEPLTQVPPQASPQSAPPQTEAPPAPQQAAEPTPLLKAEPTAAKRNLVPAQVGDPEAALADEVRLIDRARTALRANAPGLALQLLEEHRRSFTHQRLGPEAAYLRMQAALQTGNRALALAAARDITQRYPGSPHVRRAQALLSEPEAPDFL